MSLSLSVVAPYWLDRPHSEALDIAAAAEQLELDEMWFGEMMTYHAAALGGAVAARTRSLTITLGPLAVGVHTPASMAMMLGSLAAIGGRPARLALGSSSRAIVERWHGRAWRDNPRRLVETAEGVRQAAAGKTTLDGEVVRSVGFRPGIPVPEPHITIAASGPQAVAAAAGSADRVVINLVTPAAAGRIRESLDDHGAQSTPLACWVVAGSRSEPVRNQVAAAVSRYLAAPGYAEMFEEAGFGEQVAAARDGQPVAELATSIDWDLLDAIGMFGTARELEHSLGRFTAAGVSEVCVVPATADDPAGARVLSTSMGLL